MAVPKRKTSRSNTRHRRSQWKAKLPQINKVVRNGRVSGPTGPVVVHIELALVPDPAAIQAVISGAYSGGTTTSIPAGAAAPYATTIYWRTYATNGAVESPRSAWVAFRTPNAPTGVAFTR